MAKGQATDLLRERLGLFFEEAKPALNGKATVRDASVWIDSVRFSHFIDQLRAPLHQIEASTCSNPWTAAGLGHDEVRVSGALAALWDRRRYGEQASAFLARFFALVGQGFPDEQELAGGYRLQTEHCLNGSNADRVDITVETKSSLIGIELKVYAIEREKQLSRYATAIETRARLMRRAKHGVIFLAPYPPRENVNNVAAATWRAVAEVAAQADLRTEAGWLIRQFGEFCRSLGS